MANSSESPNTSIPIAHDLRKDLERRENKCILATCGIWRDFPSLGGKFVGTGSLVQGLFINFEEKIHLVTSNKVISSKDLSCYSLYFKKSRDREKEAKKLVKMVSEKMIFKSGLAIVPIDPEKLGIIRKYTSGLLKHRPFTIPTEVKKDLRNDKLYCHIVEESGKSFAISPYQVKGIADEETYVTDLNSIALAFAAVIEKVLELQLPSQSKMRHLLWVPLLLATTSSFLLFCFHRLIGHGQFQVSKSSLRS